jgi:UDP-glucose 4-epimerase
MQLAITGGSGGIGRAIVALAVQQGHRVVSIDRTLPTTPEPDVTYLEVDATNYDALAASLVGCDALIHMAAIPAPGGYPPQVVHHNNVISSYNALLAAAERGIQRVCQASSVNAIGLSYSAKPRFDYFPLDEQHPTYNDEPYSLSKWICEQQADSLVRRYATLTIASLRFHWVTERSVVAQAYAMYPAATNAHHLWAYTDLNAAARACLLAVTADFRGHEVFFIVAPENPIDHLSRELAHEFYPDVPIRGDLSGKRSFFDSSKAERILGWRHED